MNEKLRKDFSMLQQGHIYWDNSCVTFKPRQVLEAMGEYYEEYTACEGRSTHKLAEKVSEKVDEARKVARKFLRAKKDKEIIFTRNTTEGMNLVANSLDLKGKMVLTTDKEHNSNLVPWLRLRNKKVIDYGQIATEKGIFDYDTYAELLEEQDVSLVSVNHVSNLDGVENDIKKIAKMAHKTGAKVLVDGAQSAGHMEVDVRKLGVDFFACSSHKMLGPSGMGVLYVNEKRYDEMEPFMLGGGTVVDSFDDRYELAEPPQRYEAGLQNYAGMIGIGAAMKYLKKIGLNKIHKHLLKLRQELLDAIKEFNLEIVNNDKSTILTVIPQKMDSRELSRMLSGNDIQTRAGTFCVHSWFNKHNVKPAVRFSPYLYNTSEEVEAIAEKLDMLQQLL